MYANLSRHACTREIKPKGTAVFNLRSCRPWLALAAFSLLAGQAFSAGPDIPTSSPAAIAWNHTLSWTWLVERAIDLLLPLSLFLSMRGTRLIRAVERRTGQRRYLALIIVALVYLLLRFSLQFPVELARHLAYPGKDPDPTATWLAWQFQSLLSPTLAIVLLLWLPLWLIRRSPRRWWLWLTIVAAPIALVVFIGQPLWMSMNSRYKPLDDGPLRTAIVSMAAECGLARIPVVVGGDDTTVVGLGPTNRVILESGLVKTESPDQIRFTVAHELKHYVLDDNWKAFAIVVLLVLACSWIINNAAQWIFQRHGERLSYQGLADIRSFPLAVFCVVLLWTWIEPGFLAFNRHIEREADRFGLELSHENLAAATLFKSWLGELDMADPGFFAALTRSNHPSVAERIHMAENYHPWESGQPSKYSNICQGMMPATH